MSQTERERLEQLILREFDAVTPLTPDVLPRLQAFKRGGFMPSLLGFMLYCNGYSLRGTSRLHPNGLVYLDGRTLFGIGIFRKTIDSPAWHVMVSGPWTADGSDSLPTVDAFIRRLRELGVRHDIFVRHLGDDHHRSFRGRGFLPIDASPWDPDAPSEDETHSHKRIYLPDIVGNGRTIEIKTLQNEEDRGHRIKARMVFNRFSNFLDRNELGFVIRDYTLEDLPVAEALVRHHFGILKNPVGSTPEDYMSLIRFDPAKGGDQYFGKIGFLENESGPHRLNVHRHRLRPDDDDPGGEFDKLLQLPPVSIPAMLFIGERTDATTVALYATFANRDPDTLTPGIDPTGFSAISQFTYLLLFRHLRDLGIEWADVGGSETESLNTFKRQLGAVPVPSYWVVAPESLHSTSAALADDGARESA